MLGFMWRGLDLQESSLMHCSRKPKIYDYGIVEDNADAIVG